MKVNFVNGAYYEKRIISSFSKPAADVAANQAVWYKLKVLVVGFKNPYIGLGRIHGVLGWKDSAQTNFMLSNACFY